MFDMYLKKLSNFVQPVLILIFILLNSPLFGLCAQCPGNVELFLTWLLNSGVVYNALIPTLSVTHIKSSK